MNTSTDIEKLISRCALNDRAAFTDLYKATSSKLFGVVLRILKNKAEAEEALQEIYIKIWNNASMFASNAYSPMSWLIVIARNHAIDIVRVRKPDTVDIEETFDIADDKKTPEDEAINSSEGGRIDNCLSELDVNRAQAVRQAYVEGYSYDELAAAFEVPVNTMRTWLRRSLASLKKCLER
ncbi:MAG: sigma-70 family RNA polymerase sigma factor [Rhodobacteraceae bacterium]|nr:sigma-70 family RNA polymerase sigma factor [Paracoccaceae bacterium]